MDIVMYLERMNKTNLWDNGSTLKERHRISLHMHGMNIFTSYAHSKHKMDIVMYLKGMNKTNLWDSHQRVSYKKECLEFRSYTTIEFHRLHMGST
eukprot:15363805-Ditylum_brightwellii.AAC.1